ncbi:MAG: DNA-directed RNA polymerase [Cetobacterium sp.]|uniref:DNA-directed RNA polymerase n=1 Tax=Cetobacterium sp. TaxID=2071632 RepID=UPI003EE76881
MTNISQTAIEVHNNSLAQAKKRKSFTDSLNGHGTSTNFGTKLLKDYTEALLEVFEEMENTKGATRSKGWKEVVLPNKDKWPLVATCIAKSVVDNIACEPSLSTVMNSSYRSTLLTLGYTFEDIQDNSKKYKTFFGDVIEKLGPMTGTYTCESRNKGARKLYPTPELDEVIEESINKVVLATKLFTPTVEVPKPHKNLISGDGGYYSFNSPLLKYPTKINGRVHPDIANFNDETHPEFFETVNKVQSTPFVINTLLLDAVKKCYEDGLEWSDYPSKKELHLNMLDKWVETEVKMMAERGIVMTPRLMSDVVRKQEMKFRASANKASTTITMAEAFRNFESIYFPVFFDARGRRYTYAYDTLSYLGTSLSKPLIHFAQKERLNEVGLENMFAALGNALGKDKQSIKTKTQYAKQWWEDNKEAVYAQDYTEFFEDKDMDDPINALSIALELWKYETDPTWVTGFPFHLDARCSGLSIIGTLLKDKSTMELTSVIDTVVDGEGSLPDAYTGVADNAKGMVMEMDTAPALELKNNLVVFIRDFFKKPVMTLAYGDVRNNRDQAAKAKFIENKVYVSEEAMELYNITREKALKNVSPACMSYLSTVKTIARRFVKKHGYINFTAPLTNFPCVSQMFLEEQTRIDVKDHMGKRVRLVETVKTDVLDTSAMVRWAAPGVIHSTDAAILSKVSYIADFPICTIHDSYAAHPNKTNELRAIYAEQMKVLFDTCPLDSIYEELEANEGERPISVPYINTQEDGSEILNSLHIIC